MSALSRVNPSRIRNWLGFPCICDRTYQKFCKILLTKFVKSYLQIFLVCHPSQEGSQITYDTYPLAACGLHSIQFNFPRVRLLANDAISILL